MALNCAAVAESLAESELFGHEKGAFTGASSRKIGLVEIADGGTLFLDEIGDLAAPLQAKLLRVLESRRFRRVGGVKEYPTDFRLVSATHGPLQRLVEDEWFRRDLFFRINAIVVELPPLRARPEDIPLLVSHFLGELRSGEADLWEVDDGALEMLRRYAWPGNVRALRNVIGRAALLARDRMILGSDLASSLGGSVRVGEATGPLGRDASSGALASAGLPTLELDQLERIAIERVLADTGWHQGRAADILGIPPRTLHRKIRTLGLERP